MKNRPDHRADSDDPLRPDGNVGAFRRIEWQPLSEATRAQLLARIQPAKPSFSTGTTDSGTAMAEMEAPTELTAATDPILAAFLAEKLNPPSIPNINCQEEFIGLLQAVAEIEQALMAQYLYAWFTSSEKIFRTVAVQEMGHLFSVQNLLRAFDEPPHLRLPDPSQPWAKNYPLPFCLAPASLKTVAQYHTADSPLPETLPAATRGEAERAVQDAMIPVQHVGLLFLKLYWTAQPSKNPFGPWDPPLSEDWETIFGSCHLRIPTLETNQQRSWKPAWDVSMDSPTFLSDAITKGLFVGKINVASTPLAEQVCRLFYAIGAQGEGYTNGPANNSHFDLFLSLYLQWRNTGVPASAIQTVINPWIGPASTDPLVEASRITDPSAVNLAHAFNLRYERILLLIALTFTDQANTPALIATIRTQAISGEMHNLTDIAAELMQYPAKMGGTDKDLRAGPPFQTPVIATDFATIRAKLMAVKTDTDAIVWPGGVPLVITTDDQDLLDALPLS